MFVAYRCPEVGSPWAKTTSPIQKPIQPSPDLSKRRDVWRKGSMLVVKPAVSHSFLASNWITHSLVWKLGLNLRIHRVWIKTGLFPASKRWVLGQRKWVWPESKGVLGQQKRFGDSKSGLGRGKVAMGRKCEDVFYQGQRVDSLRNNQIRGVIISNIEGFHIGKRDIYAAIPFWMHLFLFRQR